MVKNMKVKVIIAAILSLFMLSLQIFAAESYEDELYTHSEFGANSITDALPEEIFDKLPSGDIFSSDGFHERFSFEYFRGLIKATILETMTPAFRSTVGVMSLVIVASVLSMLKKTVRDGGAATVFSFASSLCIMLALYNEAVSLTTTVKTYITQLSAVVTAMVPVTVAINAAGGNLSSASVSASGMMIGLAFVENLSSAGLMPVLQLCFGLSIASGIGGGVNLSGISKLVRGVFTWILALSSAIISAVMTFQSSIAVHADTLSMRAIKFAASNAVPVVGGIAGDAVRAVAGSLSLIKSTVGWVGVILIAVMTLPILARVLLTRLGIRICETASDIIGLEREKNLLSDIGGLYGFLAAVCVISGLMFIYAMALFAKSSVAAI